MKGRKPKPAGQRARRNKVAPAARLETEERPRRSAPSLGAHPLGLKWNKRTREWWKQVWESPMADEFLRADTDGLFMLAALVDQFWMAPNPKLAAEIRLQRQCYGLTPVDRRRLQWEVVRAEEAEKKRPSRKAVPKEPVADPRTALKAI